MDSGDGRHPYLLQASFPPQMGFSSLLSLGKSAGLGLLAIGLIVVVVGIALWLVTWVLTVILVALGALVAFAGFEVYQVSASADEVYQTATTVAPAAYSAFDGWIASRRTDMPLRRRLPSEYAPSGVKDLARRYVDPFLAPGMVAPSEATPTYQTHPSPAQHQQPPPQQSPNAFRGTPSNADTTGAGDAGHRDTPRFCQWCGSELSPLGTFCPRCGRGR